MSHIFISYSRKDIDFAQKIVDALAANNLDTWIDWNSIPKGEDWEQEIYRGIEGADAFLFLISPDSIASEMCKKEITYTVKNGKRILPIVIRDPDPKIIHSDWMADWGSPITSLGNTKWMKVSPISLPGCMTEFPLAWTLPQPIRTFIPAREPVTELLFQQGFD